MVEIATVTFSGIAVIISIISILSSRKSNGISKKALKSSEESNEISKNALNYSKDSFEFQNRPWLIISVKKQNDTNRYYDIVKEENAIFWKVSFVIENIGTSPASDIRVPNLINLRDNTIVNETQYINLDRIILGHGKKYQYDFQSGGQVENGENIDDKLKKYLDNDNGMQFKFIVHYKGMRNKEIEHRTSTIFSINSNTVSILNGSEAT